MIDLIIKMNPDCASLLKTLSNCHIDTAIVKVKENRVSIQHLLTKYSVAGPGQVAGSDINE